MKKRDTCLKSTALKGVSLAYLEARRDALKSKFLPHARQRAAANPNSRVWRALVSEYESQLFDATAAILRSRKGTVRAA